MKYILIAMMISMPVWAQETECVEVPEGQKIVLVPWFVPTDELVWNWFPAKDPKDCDRPLSLGGPPEGCDD